MISHKHKFIFIHIPKCAGTTIEKRLADNKTIFDWNYDNSDDGIMSAVPFPSIVVFTSFFVALFYNRNDKSDLI